MSEIDEDQQRTQLNATLKFLHATSLIPVRVNLGEKRPPGDWNPKALAEGDHSVVLADIATGNYNVGALFHGRWVDVDVDNQNPFLMRALDIFLPRSTYVWGRDTKPRSHRAYALFDDLDREKFSGVLRFVKAATAGVISEESMSLELRGGKPEAGMFTVMPGSWRADTQEVVRWDPETDMSVSAPFVDVNILVKALRMAVAAAAIAPHWVAGQRNDMSLALAGLLYRIRETGLAGQGAVDDGEVEDGVFVLSEQDAINLLRAIMVIADDSHGDENTRVQNLRNTWAKMRRGDSTKTLGGTAMAKMIGEGLGERIVSGLYRLLADNPHSEELSRHLEKFVIWYGPGQLIDLEMVRKGSPRPFMSRTQAEASLGGHKVQIGTKRVKLVDMLFNSTAVQRVVGLTFDPTTTDVVIDSEDGKKVNQWKGWSLAPHEGPVSDDDVRPFLDYMTDVIGGSDARAAAWVLDWLADILQDPGTKPGTALVLVGEQGAGKSFLGDGIMRHIIGAQHSGQVANIAHLVSGFNSQMEGKLFIVCDESTHSGNRRDADALKSLITDPLLRIERKGLDSYPSPNQVRLLFTSNRDDTAVFVDGTAFERRYTVLNVSAVRAKDIRWWTRFRAWVIDNLPKIMKWLLERVYDKQTIRRPYETTAKRVLQRHGLSPEVAFALERLEADFPLSEVSHEYWFDAFRQETLTDKPKTSGTLNRSEWPDRIRMNALEEDFRRWVRSRGQNIYGARFTAKLAEAFGMSADTAYQFRVVYHDNRLDRRVDNRVRLWHMPSREKVLSHLHERYGDIIDHVLLELRQAPSEKMSGRGHAPAEEGDMF